MGLLSVAIFVFGCASQPKTKWSEELTLWFGNAAARPTDPPRRHWGRAEEELLLKRIGHADICAVGWISSVGSFERRGKEEQITLTFLPTRMLHGSLSSKLDKDGQLVLKLDGRDLDFRRALLLQRYLPGRRFLVFLKQKPGKPLPRPKQGWRASLWRPPPPPAPIYRWALYRPEKRLIVEVKTLYRSLEKRKK
jgi:hypothetical protein